MVFAENRWLATTWKMSPARMYFLALRTAPRIALGHVRVDAQRPALAARAVAGGKGCFEQPPRAADFADRRVVFFAQAARAFGEHVANDPDAMLHVVESQQAEIEHHHAIVEAHIVAAGGGNVLDEPHHVVSEIADGAARSAEEVRERAPGDSAS